ncbi:cysteine dioxygenase family protein [Streptomyces antimycoticus]|uniref:cysteine dioxygenase family protein n=1 Tax=Streptomyces antimycoticus TaxID=68175 RepID=UPI0036C93B1E
MSTTHTPFEQFIHDMTDLTTARRQASDAELAETTGALLRELIGRPNILPEEFMHAPAGTGSRGRYVLHRCPTFTVSSIVWAPGEVAEPHNHETWGAIGVVSNRIEERRYEEIGDSRIRPLEHHAVPHGAVSLLIPDDDIHSMHNLTKQETVEIHVYGKDLTGLRRRRWSLDGDDMKEFASGKYANC